MPTNVTKPDWQCDTCGARFGTNLTAAEVCESAPPAVPLPPGTLLLCHDSSWTRNGFYLQRLFPFPLVHRWHGTVTNRFSNTAVGGHYAYYLVDFDPTPWVDDDGVLRYPYNTVDCNGEPLNGRQPRQIQGDWLWPHEPGRLQLSSSNRYSGGTGYTQYPGEGLVWLSQLLGLDHPAGTPEAEVGTEWVRPLTEPVKAVLDALGARPETAEPCSIRGWKWTLGRPLGAVAGEHFRTRDGRVIEEAAKLWLRSRPAHEVAETVNARWTAWFNGEPSDVPTPQLCTPRGRDGRKLTYSKLDKAMKKLVTATGVDWPKLTDADAYCRLLLKKTLEYTVPTTDNLFATATNIVAVGGGKGGVGKSTVAAALARRLAGDGRRVVLVDCDVTGPSQHLLFDLGAVLTDVAAGTVLPSPTGVDRLSAISPGQLFHTGDGTRWTPQSMADWMKFMGTCVDLGGADTVVLDLPPGENTIHEVVYDHIRVHLTATVHVTTGHPLALADTARSLAVIGGDHHRALRAHAHRHLVVENMSRAVGHTADGERAEIRLRGQAGATVDLATGHGIGYGGSLPWIPDAAELATCDEIGAIVKMLPIT